MVRANLARRGAQRLYVRSQQIASPIREIHGEEERPTRNEQSAVKHQIMQTGCMSLTVCMPGSVGAMSIALYPDGGSRGLNRTLGFAAVSPTYGRLRKLEHAHILPRQRPRVVADLAGLPPLEELDAGRQQPELRDHRRDGALQRTPVAVGDLERDA